MGDRDPSKNFTLSRRGVLAGLGTSLALAPWLRSPPVLAGGNSPRRLILIPMLNGVADEFFWPGDSGSLVTEPLSRHLSNMTFVRGLDTENSWDHMAVRSMFTGAPIDSYEAADPTVKSIDQVVADHIQARAPTAVRSLHLGALPATSIEFYQLYGRSTFFFNPEPVDYLANPVTAFDQLFSGLGQGPGRPEIPEKGPNHSEASLDLLQAELADLRVRADGSAQVEKVDQHVEALEALRDGGGGVGPIPVTCDNSALPSVEALRPELQGNEAAAYQQSLFNDILDAQVDNLARAVVCGLTRVATLQANSADGNSLVPVMGGLPHHDTSHASSASFALVQQWYASKVARLLDALDTDDPLDPGRTVLENSCVLWMAECNPGHDAQNIVCAYAGGLGGRLRTGTTVNVEGATNRNLLRTICDAFGVAGSDSGHFGRQSLSEVLL